MDLSFEGAPLLSCQVPNCGNEYAVLAKDILAAVIVDGQVLLAGPLAPQKGCTSPECVLRVGTLLTRIPHVLTWTRENVNPRRITEIVSNASPKHPDHDGTS